MYYILLEITKNILDLLPTLYCRLFPPTPFMNNNCGNFNLKIQLQLTQFSRPVFI